MPFDPSVNKKKKKKKKVPFDLDAAMGETEGATDGAPTTETTEVPEEPVEIKPEKEKEKDGKHSVYKLKNNQKIKNLYTLSTLFVKYHEPLSEASLW